MRSKEYAEKKKEKSKKRENEEDKNKIDIKGVQKKKSMVSAMYLSDGQRSARGSGARRLKCGIRQRRWRMRVGVMHRMLGNHLRKLIQAVLRHARLKRGAKRITSRRKETKKRRTSEKYMYKKSKKSRGSVFTLLPFFPLLYRRLLCFYPRSFASF